MKPTSLVRRNLLKTLVAAPVLGRISPAQQTAAPHTARRPARPRMMLNVRDYGATGDGTTRDTVALQQAIDRCGVLGGGEVLFPAGNYLTGAIQLRSHVLLRLDKDATLTGTPDFADYPVAQVRWEGKWIQGHSALIYANDATDTGIVGPGRIVGNNALGGRPKPDSPLRHPALIEPINCANLRFEDFSSSYHLMWSLHPTCCKNITIKNLTIRSTGGNGDGIDIDSCQHVRIDGCDIATGDDCISLKSGRGEEGYRQLNTTEDVTITNCTFADSIFACIGIGSETSGGIRNVRIDNCRFTGAKTFAFYIKSRPGRGAFIEDIVATNLDVKGTVGGFLRLNILNSGIQDADPVPGREGIPTIRNFRFMNIHVDDVPVLVDGTSIHPDKPLQGFTLSDVTGTCRRGISLANVKNAVLRGIRVTGYEGPLVSIAGVTGTGLEAAAHIDPPKTPDPVPEPATPYKLH
ncbi:MAG: glycosyl hydrolase family 28 protein [Edaphobacter sp.]|uniref:glycoside hydrolase family 28 protein n=1 Tax=Edaphobacter sp. TaxID=1934404 RepID=UPI002396FD89|nr:glycosyl hydrolase family 28 protein [Edaphobacter sp.]MDE1176964.1 glycosyl hydrolase family 28 protein [Edaphobacter sp.]